MAATGNLSKTDRAMLAELKTFLPPQVYDVHAHLCHALAPDTHQHLADRLSGELTAKLWHAEVSRQLGNAQLVGGLLSVLPGPDGDVEAANDFLLQQLTRFPDCRALVLISRHSDRARVAELLETPGVAGFKPCLNPLDADARPARTIADLLPDWAWKIADEQALVILLHLFKRFAPITPAARQAIRNRCLKHTGARLILPHGAIGFHDPYALDDLADFRSLPNLYVETSTVCDAAVLVSLLNAFGPRRILWASGFPAAAIRGTSVAVGNAAICLDAKALGADPAEPDQQPPLLGLEALRALRKAADLFGLTQADLTDIFSDNALRLLGLKTEPAGQTQSLYRYAKTRIPSGTQLLSKRPEMFAPNQWPAYFREARGCETWDLDGRHYYDLTTSGIGACLLGFRDPDVTRAVQRRISLGSMCTLNPPEEVELADRLCQIHPWAEQARFARSGGETAVVAVRIARATTRRSLVAICGYHGWHDWYLAANLGESDSLDGHLLPGLDPLGVPRELRNTTLTFRFNNRDEFQKVIDRHGDQLAAVVMEPMRYHMPEPGFMEFVKTRTNAAGALLIFDEITIGWRFTFGGSHLKLGVNPDIAIFAKALGNGHPIGAIIGTRAAMEGANASFISSTYWTESVGPVAALATIQKLQQLDAPTHVARIGEMIADLWRQHAKTHSLPVTVADGFPCLAHFQFDHPLAQELRTLYTQLMLEKGFLANLGVYPTMAHNDEIVARFGCAIDEVFGEIAAALDAGDVKERLNGPTAHSGFRRLN